MLTMIKINCQKKQKNRPITAEGTTTTKKKIIKKIYNQKRGLGSYGFISSNLLLWNRQFLCKLHHCIKKKKKSFQIHLLKLTKV